LLSLAVVGLLALAGVLRYLPEYRWGPLPSNDQIAAVSATGPACKADYWGTYVPLAQIPPLVRKAAIASKDTHFYERPPENMLMELARALAGKPQPSISRSGITRSVARCLIWHFTPDNPRCAEGCYAADFFAPRVARNLPRDRILEIYLNESYIGRGRYGVGNAAMAYFGKPLELLSIDEIALLVSGLSWGPIRDREVDRARERRNYVIDRMLQAGVISEADAASARERPLEFPERPATKAPDL